MLRGLHPSLHLTLSQNGAQHTVASLLGLGLSVWFARAVSDAGSASGIRVWGWYLALTIVHLLANYVAMRTLALRSLNPSRASLLVSDYLSQVSGEVCMKVLAFSGGGEVPYISLRIGGKVVRGSCEALLGLVE